MFERYQDPDKEFELTTFGFYSVSNCLMVRI